VTRDVLEQGPPDPATGRPTYPNAPRKPDGSIDWDRLGGERPYRQKVPGTGRRVLIDPRPGQLKEETI
jgi:hypothetical protein